ncbi:MAG: MIP family channel protein [Paludibacteraceae bacterium]|nr:MIP family channel protein [Paludibacteraceae bacterium]
MKKEYLAEMIGTMVLVLMGCGTAVSLNCGVDTASVVGTAVAFGLAVVAMAYTIGGISGCHINPSITLGCLISKRISPKDAGMYMVFQVIGAFIGSGLLALLVSQVGAAGTQTGANSCANGPVAACIVETILTFVFVLVVLGTTDSKKGAGNFAGLAIGLSLILVHLVGIHYTGTSVNPARSIAPAVFEGGDALSQLWAFIVGPFAGAALAAVVWNCIAGCCKNED